MIEGESLLGLDASVRAARGIGSPQGRQIFPLLTVEENLSVALEAALIKERSHPPYTKLFPYFTT